MCGNIIMRAKLRQAGGGLTSSARAAVSNALLAPYGPMSTCPVATGSVFSKNNPTKAPTFAPGIVNPTLAGLSGDIACDTSQYHPLNRADGLGLNGWLTFVHS